jgi:hypothetical protein
MIMLRVVDSNYCKPDERVELSDLTDEGLHQIKFECEQMIEEIEELEYQRREEPEHKNNEKAI